MSKFIKLVEADLREKLVNVDAISIIEEIEQNKTLVHISGIERPMLLDMDYLDFTNWVMSAGDVLNPRTPIDVC